MKFNPKHRFMLFIVFTSLIYKYTISKHFVPLNERILLDTNPKTISGSQYLYFIKEENIN